jgi:hypothetical protein
MTSQKRDMREGNSALFIHLVKGSFATFGISPLIIIISQHSSTQLA